MSYRFSIIKDCQLAKLELFGEISMDTLLQAFREIIEHPDYKSGFSFLTDYRSATPMFNQKDLNRLLEFAQKAKAPYRSAVVMKDELDSNFAQLWCQFSIMVRKEEFLAFSDYNEAYEWATEKAHSKLAD